MGLWPIFAESLYLPELGNRLVGAMVSFQTLIYLWRVQLLVTLVFVHGRIGADQHFLDRTRLLSIKARDSHANRKIVGIHCKGVVFSELVMKPINKDLSILVLGHRR